MDRLGVADRVAQLPRESRYTPDITATCASSLGPNADAEIPSPSASTAVPHPGHTSRCKRCSITNGTTSGSSHF